MMAAKFFRGTFGAALFLSAVPVASQLVPPPPPRFVEFFGPTLRKHSVDAECGEGSASVNWTFDGHSATLRTFTLGGRSVSPQQFSQIQDWMIELGGDVLIDLECAADGERIAASIRLMNAQSAGSGVTRMIRAHIIDGALIEFARYHFDGTPISRPRKRSEVR